jgi:hypothetical protein
MTTTVKRVNVPAIGSPLDVICTEVFNLECELYKIERDVRAMKRRLKDLRKARTVLKRLAPKEDEPSPNDNW